MRFIMIDEVIHMTGMCRTAIYKRISTRDFPGQIKIGSSSYWDLDEVEAWMKNKVFEKSGAA